MKKIFFVVTLFAIFSCNNEIDDIVNDYKTKPKSEDLYGFWQLEGVYPIKNTANPITDIGIGQGLVGIGLKEILFLDNQYLRFLNKSSDGDSLYAYNSKNKFYWYNENQLIKSVHESDFNSKNFQNINQYQIPYKFGQSKDTLVVQSNGTLLYLIKKTNVDYTEYVFD